MDMQQIGAYAFLGGVAIAILAGIGAAFFAASIGAYAGAVTLILVLLGLLVGFVNIKDKETTAFLIASIALMSVGASNLSALNIAPGLGTALTDIVLYIAVFVAPAALIIALKSIWSMAKEA